MPLHFRRRSLVGWRISTHKICFRFAGICNLARSGGSPFMALLPYPRKGNPEPQPSSGLHNNPFNLTTVLLIRKGDFYSEPRFSLSPPPLGVGRCTQRCHSPIPRQCLFVFVHTLGTLFIVTPPAIIFRTHLAMTQCHCRTAAA